MYQPRKCLMDGSDCGSNNCPPDDEQEEISPLEQAIADEDFDAVLAILDEARRQVIKQALKHGGWSSLVNESVRRPV